MRRFAPALAALPLLLGACGGEAQPTSGGPSPTGDSWIEVEPGKPTTSPATVSGGSPRPALPPVSFLPTDPACAVDWNEDVGKVLIPMIVTPGPGSLSVQWPNRYGKRYRVAAVPQELVSGAQPEPVWQTISTGAGCTGSATISGLRSGAAYVVWLDAPDTPRDVDGSRSLYSGRSEIVIPN